MKKFETSMELAEYLLRFYDSPDVSGYARLLDEELGKPGTTGLVVFTCQDLGRPNVGDAKVVRCGTEGDLNFAHPSQAEGKTYGHWSYLPDAYLEVAPAASQA